MGYVYKALTMIRTEENVFCRRNDDQNTKSWLVKILKNSMFLQNLACDAYMQVILGAP